MKFIFILLTLLSQIGFSQQATNQSVSNSGPPVRVTKVIRVRYGVAQKVADLIRPGTSVTVSADNLLNVIVLAGYPNDVAPLEQTVRELDVPSAAIPSYKSKNIELIVSVIGGSDTAGLIQGGSSLDAMAPVIKQLQAVFPYKNYQVFSSMLLRSSEGARTESFGVMKNLTNSGSIPPPNVYAVSYDEATVSPEGGRPVIHLRNFSFKASNIFIRTDIDLREGQKVVAGKANNDNNDLALFVVLTARIVE